MWFDVIGNSLAFIGSVLFSADLLKTKGQIRDENATYFDRNPYTTESGLASIPAYVFAFFLVVTGFAVTLGGNIGEAAELSLPDSILVVALTALSGYLATVLIYLVNKRHHQETKIKLKINSFYSSLKNLSEKYEKFVIGQHNEVALFTIYKSTDIKHLESRLDEMIGPPEKHMKDIVAELTRKRTANTFRNAIGVYLQSHTD